MAMERPRVSVSASAMSFDLCEQARNYRFNLVDTAATRIFEGYLPHVTAVTAAVRVIDGAKGRGKPDAKSVLEGRPHGDLPILTFVKQDGRESRECFRSVDEFRKTRDY